VIRGNTVGERLRYLRTRRVLTLRELAERAGMTRWQTIADIEAGRTRPRPSTLRKIAAALGVDPADLLPEDGDPAA
jgi:HTH-type transcriptional regulator, competence development regulator